MKNRKERIIPFTIIGLMMFISSFKLIDNSGLAICGWWILSAGIALWLTVPLLIFWGKPSAHMLPMGAAVALFMHEGYVWASNDMLFISGIAILCAGFVASSRLFLKAHTNKELIVGTILGILVILPML